MSRKLPTVAIVGRTNVGKSTLFNALVGKRVSIVEDEPGVTRDRHYQLISRAGATYTLVDTGGMVGGEEDDLQQAVRAQSRLAVEESDLIVAVFDGLSGPHPLDEEVVSYLRRTEKPVIWVANKCEKESAAQAVAEFYAFGIDDILPISAAHRVGVQRLTALIAERLGFSSDVQLDESELRDEEEAAPQDDGIIRVAVIGKPNVGKSSIINRIIGEERVIASSKPGTTTDSIDVPVKRDGQEYIIVDTAGLRRKAKVEDYTVERYGNLRTLRALARCDIAVLVLDASEGIPHEQDIKIAGLIHERGKGLIIVVNKWDLVEKDHRTVKAFTDTIQNTLTFAKYAPILFVSALSGRRCPSILQSVKEIYDGAKLRIATADLNRILSRALVHRPPPVYRGEPIRLFFATQIGISPPTFVLFLNFPRRLNAAYQRYLKSAIRKHYPFEGVDIKFHLRKRTSKADRDAESSAA